jgi:hypothetical protein
VISRSMSRKSSRTIAMQPQIGTATAKAAATS